MTQHQIDPALQDGARSRALDVPLDLRKYVAIFRRRLGLFVSVALLIFVGAVVVTIQTTPRYPATVESSRSPTFSNAAAAGGASNTSSIRRGSATAATCKASSCST